MKVPIERFDLMTGENMCVVADIIDNSATVHFIGWNKVRANEIFKLRESSLWVKGNKVATHKEKKLADLCDTYFKEIENEFN